MVEIKRKPKESTGAFVRRFSRQVQQSRILLRAREVRFHRKPPTRRARRLSAIRREGLKKYYEKLKKLGKPGK